MTSAPPNPPLSADELREMFSAATHWLETNRDRVNSINVFPVPDGDTGTNMYLTMRSALDEAEKGGRGTVGEMMAAMSHGALMGARGNSGVILSQILRGAARGMDGADTLDAAAMAAALREGSAAAYSAVTNPAEGTILTVVRETAEAVSAVEGDLLALLEVAVAAAGESVARTPQLLPVLAEAGVVDAGGEGLRVLLDGMLRYVRGESLEPGAEGAGTVEAEWLSVLEGRHAVEESLYGYCTEVLVEGADVDVQGVREAILKIGDSVLVVGDETLVRIHVHTDEPGEALNIGTRAGALVQVKVDNIRRQAEAFVQMHTETPEPGVTNEGQTVSCVAVASGDGLGGLFIDMGCAQVVSGGPTMNPSTAEILEAIESCPTDDVIVLPNDKNIIMASEQAVPHTKKNVRIVKSRSVPQGIAALLAFNFEHGAEENESDMTEALSTVRTVEVTRAVRSTSIGGVKVEEGQAIAVVDDVLKVAAESAVEAALEALGDIVGESALVTVYYGAGITSEQANELASRVREKFPTAEADVHFGGQPHFDYILSVE